MKGVRFLCACGGGSERCIGGVGDPVGGGVGRWKSAWGLLSLPEEEQAMFVRLLSSIYYPATCGPKGHGSDGRLFT